MLDLSVTSVGADSTSFINDIRSETTLNGDEADTTPLMEHRSSSSLPDGDSNQMKPLIISNGLHSNLFKPLYVVVFTPKKLKKEIILNCDLGRLCIALLQSIDVEESPFPIVGYYVNGMCVILSQRLKFMNSDVLKLNKSIQSFQTIYKPRRDSNITYYESDDEEFKVRRKKRVSIDTDRTFRLSDYQRTVTEETIQPISVERLELLQKMNLGIGMGLGTELAFYNTDNYLNSPQSSDCLQKYDSQGKDWLDFDDLHLLSPYKLNAYSYTPGSNNAMDDATMVASSDVTARSFNIEMESVEYEKSYDMDWSIYNDPLDEGSAEILAIEDKPEPSKTPMVRREIKYDRKLTFDVSTRRKRRRKSLGSSRIVVRQIQEGQQLLTNLVAPMLPDVADAKSKTFDLAFESIYENMMDHNAPIDVPSICDDNISINSVYSEEYIPIDLKFDVNSKLTTNEVLEGYRDCVREYDNTNISFKEMTKTCSKYKASVIFFRTLLLANSNFVSLHKDDDIFITPSVSHTFKKFTNFRNDFGNPSNNTSRVKWKHGTSKSESSYVLSYSYSLLLYFLLRHSEIL